jgi:hypothetical protein
MLGDKGAPEIVDRVLIAPPSARVGPITPEERAQIIRASKFGEKYDTAVDRESAFETLEGRAAGAEEGAGGGGWMGTIVGGVLATLFGSKRGKRLSPAEIALRSAVQSAARSAGTQIAKQILRGTLGGITK